MADPAEKRTRNHIPSAPKSPLPESPIGWAFHKNVWVNLLIGTALTAGGYYFINHFEDGAVLGAKAISYKVTQATAIPGNVLIKDFDGQLVLVNGDVKGEGEITDPLFGGKAEAVCLLRKVEMLQWVEEKDVKILPDGTESVGYTYGSKWSEKILDSSGFAKRGHDNPREKPYPSMGFASPAATLGVFKLSGGVCGAYTPMQPIPFTEEDFNAVKGREKVKTPIVIKDNAIFAGRSPAKPGVGDVRITYFSATPENATALARMKGAQLLPIPIWDGGDLTAFREGRIPLEQMYTPIGGSSYVKAAVFRLLGFFAMTAGLMAFAGGLEEVILLFPLAYGLLTRHGLRTAATASAGLACLAAAPAWTGYFPYLTYGLYAVSAALAGWIGREIKYAVPRYPLPPQAPPKPTSGPVPMFPAGGPGEHPAATMASHPPHMAAEGAPPPPPDNMEPEGLYIPNVYTPKKMAVPAPVKDIEKAFVFHEKGKMDKEITMEIIRKRETLPGRQPPKVGGMTGVHIAAWPKDSEKLEELIRKGIGVYLKKHPDLPYYMDKGAYEIKTWQDKNAEMGKFAVALVIAKKGAKGA